MKIHILRKLALTCLSLCSVFYAIAQTGNVTGTVLDAKGEPLAGASVLLEFNNKGTRTDNAGMYTIIAAPGTYNVVASFAGKSPGSKQVTIISGQTISTDFTLQNGEDLTGVVVIGSRTPRRVNTETPVPVDVLNISELTRSAPQSNLNQILNYVAPSFTSNTQTVADGTDHIDPAQLRGLGPDQVLVLMNGKRRHTSSLVNVNGTPGRGSVGTDLNAIPAFAIERIEVLRDGAAAQYGSDAIAGVINVVMKKSVNQLTGAVYGGGNFSRGANDHRGGVDGQQLQIDLNYGLPIGKKGGSINFTASAVTREATRRATDFNGSIFNAYNAVEERARRAGTSITSLFSNINNTPNTAQIISAIKQFAPQVSYFSSALQTNIQNATTISGLQGLLGGNVSDDELNYRGLTRRDFNMRVGQSKLNSGQIFMNTEVPISGDHKFYTFGGYGLRDGNSAGFYRRPNQNRTLTQLYPNGFLPEIGSTITDASIALGVKGKIFNDWNYDLSNTYGQNQFKYTIENTSNATIGNTSPTSFNAGKLGFRQNTVNLDLSRGYDVLAGLNVAVGGEVRLENYKITAGDEDSYQRYDINGAVATGTTAANLLPTDFFGSARPSGAQVFPGFSPANAVDESRNSQAGYVDVELNPTKSVLINGAVRFENYSDFGSTINYKFATRVKVANGLNLRAAIATGFRAPSLPQRYFNSTATQFLGGVPFEVGTFRNGGKVANALGIPDLKQEDSYSYSAGVTYKVPNTKLTFTVDGYFIKIKNRIILTGQFARPGGVQTGANLTLQQLFDAANATSATFFTNAINTESRGVDYIVSNVFNFSDFSLKTDLAGTVSQTRKVGDIKASDILKQTGNLNNYFSESSRIYLESAVPRNKLALINTLNYKKIDFFIRSTYFGAVTDPNTTDINGDGLVEGGFVNGSFIAVEHPVWSARSITDLSVGVQVNKQLRITAGANNIFDIYPDLNYKTQTAAQPSGGTSATYGTPGTIDLSNNNQFQYSRNVSQFGFNGRFLFARLNFTFDKGKK